MVGPGPPIEPPLPATPLTVSKGFTVSYRQGTCPSEAASACTTPSQPVAKTTPGITESADSRPAARPAAGCSGANHFRVPSASRLAITPPLDRPKYAASSSAAPPQTIWPAKLGFLSAVLTFQTTAPLRSGSWPQTRPLFCPATRMLWPLGRSRRIGDAPKSKSGPRFFGQFSGRGVASQPTSQASPPRSWTDQRTLPVLRSSARIESVPFAAGSV